MVSLHTNVELLLACVLIAQAWQLVLTTYALVKNDERRRECQKIEARDNLARDRHEMMWNVAENERVVREHAAHVESTRRRFIASKMSRPGTTSGDEYARWPANVAEIIERYEAIDRKLGKPQ